MTAAGVMPVPMKAGETERKADEFAALAAWYVQLAETNNATFLPLFADQHRYLVLKGGGGSGKSIFAGRKVLERCTSEAGHRWLVCRKVARTLRESCFKQLCSQVAEYYPGSGYKINKSDMVISFANGSEILFAGLDDVEKLKSIYNITGIWIEEASELLEGDFNQLDIRLRGKTRYYLDLAWVPEEPQEAPEEPAESTEAELAEAWVQSAGIMAGYADGDMHLDDPVTRRQMMLVVYRLAKLAGLA